MKNSTLDRNPMLVLFVREASGIKAALPLIEKFTVVRSPTYMIGVEKAFSQKGGFIVHIRVHMGLKPYPYTQQGRKGFHTRGL